MRNSVIITQVNTTWSPPLWEVTQLRLVFSYRRFGTNYQSTSWLLRMVQIGFPETSATFYQYTARNIPKNEDLTPIIFTYDVSSLYPPLFHVVSLLHPLCMSGLCCPCDMPRPSYPPTFDYPITVLWGIQITKLCMCSFLYYPILK